MHSSIKIGLFFLFLTIFGTGCTKHQKETRPIVSVTTFPLYDIVKHIAGDSVKIVHILPFGVEPHEYEPTPKIVASIEKSALIFYSGAGLEPWTAGFHFKQRAVNMSQYVALNHFEKTRAIDPHYWLDFQNMKKAVTLITRELIQITPKYKQKYIKNEKAYLEMLEKLDEKFKITLAHCNRDTIIVNHNAFGYLAKKYGFGVASLSGLSPEAQPNAKNIIRLIETIKEHNVSTVFFEDFASDKAIKGIANATHTAVDVLKPLGNITADEAKENLSYEAMMQINLQKLSKALSCH